MPDSANPAKEGGLSRALERIDKRLSRDLRALRQARSLTLAQIAGRIGRSVGWMSQVERGISMPTLADLRRLADQFGVPMSLFYAREQRPDTDGEIVVRHDERRVLRHVEDGLTEELLSPSLGGSFQMRRRLRAGSGAARGRGGRLRGLGLAGAGDRRHCAAPRPGRQLPLQGQGGRMAQRGRGRGRRDLGHVPARLLSGGRRRLQSSLNGRTHIWQFSTGHCAVSFVRTDVHVGT